jgi:hypothetical protein
LALIRPGFYSPNVLDFLLFLAILMGVGSIAIGMLGNTVPTPFAPEARSSSLSSCRSGGSAQ